MANYKITMSGHNGNHGNDWASEMYFTMFGTKASTGEFDLASTGSAEPGMPHTYHVALADLGEIQRMRVRHHDTGVGHGCYLDRVVVQAADTVQEWTFLCQRWLARHEDDGATERTLDALVAEHLSGLLFLPLSR
jgi:hypothetical protein